MKKIVLLCLILLSVSINSYGQKPVSDPTGNWALLSDYSDEFDGTTINSTIWDYDINDWGAWSWEPQYVYLTGTGSMKIKMVNEQHVRSGTTYYFKSGAARQKKEITYGYFESRVKGCAKWPGVCPAFWMYSVNQPVTNTIKYNEIDFMEIQQRQFNLKIIDTDLHLERVISGSTVRTDIRQSNTQTWNPNDAFHVYGCKVTPTEITIYIDGVQVATRANDYFHLPMRVILSMGLRPPLMTYDTNGDKLPVATTTEPGFPTEMEADYVRVWQALVPISLSSFTGKEVNKVVELNWITASEKNNKTFEILRSSDGKTFSSIGTVNGAGNSNDLKTYTFKDENPLAGTNYYQLKQIDYDGTSTLSGIVAVDSKRQAIKVSVHANTEGVKVNIVSPEETIAQLVVYDISGRIVADKVINLNKGENTALFTENFQSGMHIVQLIAKRIQVSEKFVK